MEERTSGIILRTRLFTDTSLIVRWITPDLGKIATIAKGARRAKSTFLGRLDLFYEAQFSFIRSRRSELHTLKEVTLIQTHSGLRRDFTALSLASYYSVLIDLATESETPVPELWELLRSSLERISARPIEKLDLFAFELRLLVLSGFEPRIPKSGLGRKAEEYLVGLMNHVEWTPNLEGSDVGKEVNRFLQTSIGMAFEKVPAQRLDLARMLKL
jgi:DNA repair protein RecO (recombination protein O)